MKKTYPYIDEGGREVRLISSAIDHQNIGGKEFIVDEQITPTLTNWEVFMQATKGNWACYNFIKRREDFDGDFEHKLYYGKVGGLGYIVAEDEFINTPKKKLIRKNVFETNSSSTHVITIPRKIDKSLYGKRPSIHFGISDFGWEYGKHALADYIWTAICDIYPDKYKEYQGKITNILNSYYNQIEFEEPKFDESYDDDGNLKWRYLDSMQGYVDHCRELTDFLDEIFENEELFVNAILDGYVRTGNDNDDGYDLDDLDNNPDYYHYYKGN